jgi:hypothetical protein
MESGKVYVRNYIRLGEEQNNPADTLSPEHSKDNTMPTTMQQDKNPKSKTSRQRRTKIVIPDIVVEEILPVDTLIKEYPEAKQSKKRKTSQDPGMPKKPNIKTRLTNQLRLNSKALFDPSLKDKNPIVIEDEDTEEGLSKFVNMEEMAIHTLKEMIGDKEKKKCSKGEISGVKYVVVKTKYPADMESEKNVMESGSDPEQDSNYLTPGVELSLEQVPHDVKSEIKGKTLMIQELVRETIDKISKKTPRYEMRLRKSKIFIDLNKSVAEEEQGLNNGNKLKTLIKPKVEYARERWMETTRCKLSRSIMMT